MKALIFARCDRGAGAELDCRRQHESIVVVGVLADQIYTARCAKQSRGRADSNRGSWAQDRRTISRKSFLFNLCFENKRVREIFGSGTMCGNVAPHAWSPPNFPP